ncbi:DHHW family protein [Intestinibacter sp.]
MNIKLKNIVISVSFVLILIGFMIGNIFLNDKYISYEERRKLTQRPQFEVQELVSGEYFEDMEKYLLDQFPLRYNFRELKNFVNTEIFKQKDNNDIYIINNNVFKMEYKLNEKSIYESAVLYNEISDRYFKNSNVYYTIVPDKNYFVPKSEGYLSLDYEKLIDIMKKNTANMKYIDIIKDLQISDYYNTDLHWRQENLLPVATNLLKSMDNKVSHYKYEENKFTPFYGSYYGQAATNLKPDEIVFLSNSITENCKVYDFAKQEYIKVYDEKDFANVDSYDIYLGGAKPLLSIENRANKSGKELYIFRDSFGSSLAPLLINEYSKITLVDLRYISSVAFEEYVKPVENSDVLFMYNTSILNNSNIITKFIKTIPTK